MTRRSSGISRRELLKRSLAYGAVATVAPMVSAQNIDSNRTPVIDTHIHLFDPTRPQSAPYRGPRSARYFTEGAFPDDYLSIAETNNVYGAIKVEASPWIEDNLWALQQCQESNLMVGYIGNIDLYNPQFASLFDRFSNYDIFLGLRYGNLWGYSLAQAAIDPVALENLRLLQDKGLVLDAANPNLELLQAIVRVSDALPDLRVIVDHLPKYNPVDEEMTAYLQVLQEMKDRQNIFCKISSIIHTHNGRLVDSLVQQRERLDLICSVFGSKRVIFGSDWPNNEADAPVADVFAIAREYFSGKSSEWFENYFWRNSIDAYSWVPRSSAQKELVDRF